MVAIQPEVGLYMQKNSLWRSVNVCSLYSIIFIQGTGHYLSPGRGGAGDVFWADHWIFRMTEEGLVIPESLKGVH